jgi:hypothetical protein
MRKRYQGREAPCIANRVSASLRTTPTLTGRWRATRLMSREGAAALWASTSKPREPPATRQPRRRGGRRAEVPLFANKQRTHTLLSQSLTTIMQTAVRVKCSWGTLHFGTEVSTVGQSVFEMFGAFSPLLMSWGSSYRLQGPHTTFVGVALGILASRASRGRARSVAAFLPVVRSICEVMHY